MRHIAIFLTSVFMALMTSQTLSSQEPDTVRVSQLQEVTVEGDNVIHRNGYDILLLNSSNRSFGTNALDAVSSLNRFVTNINDDKLLASDRTQVFILINGVPSTAMDLRSYKGSDIKNVEYYPVAPSQYMAFTDGPLVNVVMKKRHDRLFTGYFNAANAVNTGFGTDQAELSYSDSLNQVKLGYTADYRNISDISNRKDYSLAPDWTSAYDDRQRYKGEYHAAYGSYQHYRTNHLFNAKLSFVAQPTRETSAGEHTFIRGVESIDGASTSLMKSNAKSVSLELYYNYVLKNGSVFVVNVLNTLGRSSSESQIDSYQLQPASSSVKSRSYSLVANTFFSSRALGGKYTVGSRYEYKQLSQVFAGSTDRPYSHKEFLSLGMSWWRNDMSFVPTVALSVLARSEGDGSRTYALPYANFYWDWWPSSFKGFSVQLTLFSRFQAPQLSMLTDSYSYRDYGFLAAGNPCLKNYWENSAKLSFTYFVPGRKDYVALVGRSDYYRDPIASTLSVIDGTAYLRPANLDYSHRMSFYLYGSWYPFKWLELSPYTESYVNRYDASTEVRDTYFRVGGSITATLGSCVLRLSANSPTKDFDGDLVSRGSAQYSATFQYKVRGWSFGARYNYSGHNDRTYGEAGAFSMEEERDLRPLHNLVRLDVTYSFSVGRSRRHARKMVSESSDDNGLNQYNTPKKPD